MTVLICTICSAEYTPKKVRKDSKYCGTKCKNRGMHILRKARGPIEVTTTCTLDGCEEPSKWNGSYCGMHYGRIKLHGAPGVPERVRGGRYGVITCEVEGCERKYAARGLCTLHYGRLRLDGDPGQAELKRKPVSKDTVWRWTDPDKGYVYLTFPGERLTKVLEHRHVMELHLGRPLWPDETVHHKNGNRADNRLTNLELWSSLQPAGQRVEDKLEYAREIIARYGDIA